MATDDTSSRNNIFSIAPWLAGCLMGETYSIYATFFGHILVPVHVYAVDPLTSRVLAAGQVGPLREVVELHGFVFVVLMAFALFLTTALAVLLCLSSEPIRVQIEDLARRLSAAITGYFRSEPAHPIFLLVPADELKETSPLRTHADGRFFRPPGRPAERQGARLARSTERLWPAKPGLSRSRDRV
jgi:hypothetical protein